jgi:hypothetical protein
MSLMVDRHSSLSSFNRVVNVDLILLLVIGIFTSRDLIASWIFPLRL